MDLLEKYFDEWAKRLDRLSAELGYKAPQIICPDLMKLLKKDDKILDLGVGTGLSSKMFLRKGFYVVGMDFSREVLKQAGKYKYKKLIKQDLHKKLKVKTNFFNAAVCLGVFDFFKNLNHVFRETKRVLKKDSYFAFTVIKSQKYHKPKERFTHTKKEIKELAKKHKFRIVKEYEFLAYKIKKTKTYPGYSCRYYAFILQKI